MKNIYLLFPLMGLIAGCSGIAPEAWRDESNTLTRPPFMKSKVLDDAKQKDVQLETKSDI